MNNTTEIIKACEDSITKLKDIFKTKSNEYFFTEKELHSYLYHLCIGTGMFEHDEYNLIHTEYPTPFKCEQINDEPYIIMAAGKKQKMRAHIDFVVVNPNFIHWTGTRNNKNQLISGIANKVFDKYMAEFIEYYTAFCNETGESILLYAIEFKYLRHNYSGQIYPIREISQDINKLKLLTDFKIGTPKVSFCEKVKSIVFVGERNICIKTKLNDLVEVHKDICEAVYYR